MSWAGKARPEENPKSNRFNMKNTTDNPSHKKKGITATFETREPIESEWPRIKSAILRIAGATIRTLIVRRQESVGNDVRCEKDYLAAVMYSDDTVCLIRLDESTSRRLIDELASLEAGRIRAILFEDGEPSDA